MTQTRRQSLVEAGCNIAIGYAINCAANLVVLPMFGCPVSVKAAGGIGLVFTAISLCRSYVLRRLFNGWHK